MESEGVIIFDGYRNQNHLTVDADERNKRLSQLEEDTVALRDIFANLGELVNDQRETVKSIADFTDVKDCTGVRKHIARTSTTPPPPPWINNNNDDDR